MTVESGPLRLGRSRLGLVLVALLLIAACGRSGEAGEPTTTTTLVDSTTSTSTSTTTPDSTTTTTSGEESLPGQRIEIFPYQGAELMVVGVAFDDTLNVRAGPGVDFDVLFELDPLAEGIVATGHNRQLSGVGTWAEIEVEGELGWANVAFLLQPGVVDDITSQLWPNPADRMSARTMLELGEAVAGLRASDEPPSKVVVVDGPTVGDLGEITVDVIGFGDDAVGGERLRIFAEADPGGEGFVVRTVEAIILCSRAVTDEGFCV